MKKGAIFDMDGLMFDTERVYQQTWTELAVEMGETPNPVFPHAVAGTLGERMYEVIRTYYPSIDPVAMWDACKTRVAAKVAQKVPEKPGLRVILPGLQAAGVKIAVASSSPPETIRQNLERTGLEGYFDAVVSSVHVGRGKPFPDVFLLAAKALGLDPSECWVLEDSPNGIRAGHAAGCTTILVPDVIVPGEEVLALCDWVCSDLGLVWARMQAEDGRECGG